MQNALGFPDAGAGHQHAGPHDVLRGRGRRRADLRTPTSTAASSTATREAPAAPGATIYAEPSPDYFQYVDLGGPGLVPVGYGYRSVEYIVGELHPGGDRKPATTLAGAGRRCFKEFDAAGIMATPANSGYNELVMEAGRESILNGGATVEIKYRRNRARTAS